MDCPQCGGSSHRTIASGYFECTSVVLITQRDWVPDVTRPGAMRPLDVQSHSTCRHRWHERDASLPPVPTCSACGTFAISLCFECGTPICGDHSKLMEPGRLCAQHAKPLEDEISASRQQATQAAREKAVRDRDEIVNQLRSIADPKERLVRALRRFCTEQRGDDVYARFNFPLLGAACLEFWPEPLIAEPDLNGRIGGTPWNSQEMADWFAKRASEVRLEPDSSTRWTYYRKSLIGKLKWSEGPPEPAWHFPGGSTAHNGGRSGTDRAFSAYILPDGRLDLGPDHRYYDTNSVERSAERYALRGYALIHMAELLDLD